MRKWIVTFFGSGMSPVAPGTAGSFLASVFMIGGFWLCGARFYPIILLAGLAISCVLSIALGGWAVRYYGRDDPQPFVLDEVAGICLTNLFLPVMAGWGQVGIIGLAFLAFRVFDIVKPPPARQLEKLPQGWGILLDDLAAAVYANILCHLLLYAGLHRLM